MECCSSTSSSNYEEDLENVCTIVAADTVTVRRKVWVHDINMKSTQGKLLVGVTGNVMMRRIIVVRLLQVYSHSSVNFYKLNIHNQIICVRHC